MLIAAALALSCGPAKGPETMPAIRDRVIALACGQAAYMDSLLSSRATPEAGYPCPRTFQGDTLVTSDIGWWTSGFYPGVLWQIFEETKDPRFMRLAVRHTLPLTGLLDRETDHDIGFQLMSSFGKMARDCQSEHSSCHSEPVSGEGISPKAVLARGAETLAARFVPEAGVLRSWNWGPWNIPVIIDNMMNLELLMQYGDRTVAEKHALTTLENHFREDGTTYHLVDYADDGSVLGRQTVQGYADETAWARGQAWALYGYAMMACEEQKAGNPALAATFLGAAGKLADWILPRLPEDGVPYWDFSQTDYRDASAGAIIAAGLLRLREARQADSDSPIDPDDPLLRTAGRILRTLASPEYLAEPRTNGGFLLKHSVGNLPGRSEVDVPLTYADYYFLEALTRYPR